MVATGLPLHGGVPLGCDCTMVSPVHANGQPWAGCATEAGVAIRRAEVDKEKTYRELVGSGQLRLVTLACEVGGRWSKTCVDTVRALAAAKARSAPRLVRASALHAWEARWWTILSVGAQSALAATLTEEAVMVLDGHDGEEPPLADVLFDATAAPM